MAKLSGAERADLSLHRHNLEQNRKAIQEVKNALEDRDPYDKGVVAQIFHDKIEEELKQLGIDKHVTRLRVEQNAARNSELDDGWVMV